VAILNTPTKESKVAWIAVIRTKKKTMMKYVIDYLNCVKKSK